MHADNDATAASPSLRNYDGSSAVEPIALERSGRCLRYEPAEKIGIVEAENFPLLGKITALRFVEWVQKNPGGVIALPTGRTPETFIRWTNRILGGWNTPEIRRLLADWGVDPEFRPDMGSLVFVQIDEFYPMDAGRRNSFHYYVDTFYLQGFGLDRSRALLIDTTELGLPPGMSMERMFPDGSVDLSLRVRQTQSDQERLQKEVINRVDSFCTGYETRIRGLGGIGFFLGGIGPDGHIAFNVRGSSIYSVTRLTGTNYETQAAAATDLGGIETSRNRLVITIGLATITYNPQVTAIILAAGSAKTAMVRAAAEEEKDQQHPASVLQGMANARFYLTSSIARSLSARRLDDFRKLSSIPEEKADEIAIGVSLRRNKPLADLTRDDFSGDPLGRELLRRNAECIDICLGARDRMIAKLMAGLEPVKGTSFLHTEPHQDDIMLAYLSHVYHLVRDPTNRHHFANLTSGFTSVTNGYILEIVKKLSARIETDSFRNLSKSGYFSRENEAARMEDVYLFLDGSAAYNQEKRDDAEARRLLRNIVDVYNISNPAAVRSHIIDLQAYLVTQYPGAKDPPDVQTLKGAMREWEAELLWAHFGIEARDIHALRLGFYAGDLFTEEPQVARDVRPIVSLLEKTGPDVITVAFDPEGSGPDTHYKALQAVAEAVKIYHRNRMDRSLRIWGYRNIWYRFSPAEANIYVPVSLNTLSLLDSAFMNCFGSQRAASFPSFEHDGPFSQLARKIQVEQYAMLKCCLGKEFFLQHEHPRLRAARGMIFLKEMQLPDFFEKVRELREATEEEKQ